MSGTRERQGLRLGLLRHAVIRPMDQAVTHGGCAQWSRSVPIPSSTLPSVLKLDGGSKLPTKQQFVAHVAGIGGRQGRDRRIPRSVYL